MSKKLLIYLLSIMLFTFLRQALLIVLPIILVIIIYGFKVKSSVYILLSFLMLILSVLVNAVFFDFHPVNNIMSFLLLFLPTVLVLSRPQKHYFSFADWMKYSSHVLIFVNITAVINFLYVLISGHGIIDDAFNGLYGRGGLSMHTFSLVNFIYCVCYFNVRNIRKALLFFVFGFFCFYGLGLILFILSVSLVLLRNINRKHINYLFRFTAVLFLIVYTIDRIDPHTFSYLKENIHRSMYAISLNKPYESEMRDVRKLKTVKTPRKLLAFEGAAKMLSDPPTFFFGMAPGTYNSRTSFLLNGEYSSNRLFRNANIRPKHAEHEVYPLWNKRITFQYNDGTRNEPFSSLIAVAVEYGVLQLLLFFLIFRKKYKDIKANNPQYGFFIRFLFFFALFNLVAENYLEYPEFMLLLLMIFYSMDGQSAIKEAHV